MDTSLRHSGLIYISSYLTELVTIQSTFIARVHSVFSSGFNLQYRGQLIFIGTHNTNLSAFGMSIELSLLKEIIKVISVGELVKIKSADQLELTLYTRPKLMYYSFEQIEYIDLSLPYLSMEQLLDSGLIQLLEEAHVWEHSGFLSFKALEKLYEAFSLNSTHSLAESVQPFIGAGIGLTPTGDDFLQGMILIEILTKNGEALKETIKDQLANRSTTDVSHAYYNALFAGFVNQSWLSLFDSIVEGNSKEIRMNIRDIQHYGATSGNDILVGVLTYLKQTNRR